MTGIQRFHLGLIVMFRLVRATSRGEVMGVYPFTNQICSDITICAIDSSNTKAKIGRDPKTCTVQLGTKAVAVSREHADLNWNSVCIWIQIWID